MEHSVPFKNQATQLGELSETQERLSHDMSGVMANTNAIEAALGASSAGTQGTQGSIRPGAAATRQSTPEPPPPRRQQLPQHHGGGSAVGSTPSSSGMSELDRQSALTELRNTEAAEAADAAEQAEEAAALARAEGEATRVAEAAAPRASTVPATPETEYGHLPIPVRAPMGKVSSWTLNNEVHVAGKSQQLDPQQRGPRSLRSFLQV